MGNFQLPQTTLLDASGDPVSGGTVEFYAQGTTTPLSVYSDSGLTTLIGTSVTSDSSGRMQNVWIDSDTGYKVIVKDASGATLYTEDNLLPYGTSGDASFSYQSKIASHPLQYGALGDGVADESAAVQSAITNATGTMDLLGLTYRVDSQLTVSSDVRIVNGTLDFTSCTDSACILVNSSSLSATVDLAANLAVGGTSVDVDPTDHGITPLAAGDFVSFSSTHEWDNGSGSSPGEMLQVKSVATDTITFKSPATLAWSTATTATIRKVPMVERVMFSEVMFIGGTTAGQDIIDCQHVSAPTIKDCQFTSIVDYCVLFTGCYKPSVVGCYFANSTSASGKGVGTSGNCTALSVRDSSFEDVGVGVEIGKPAEFLTNNTIISRCIFHGSKYSVYIGVYSRRTVVHGCDITAGRMAGSVGIYNLSGSFDTISDNTITFGLTASIYVKFFRTLPHLLTGIGTDEDCLVISGNQVMYADTDSILIENQDDCEDIGGIVISGNTISATYGAGSSIQLNISGSPRVDQVIISDNSIPEAYQGIDVTAAASVVVTGLAISENSIEAEITQTGINIAGTELGSINHVTVSGNSILNGSVGLNAQNVGNMAITGNSFDGQTSDAIKHTPSGTAGTLANVVITDNVIQSAGANGINVDHSVPSTSILQDVVIKGNTITDTTTDAISVLCGASGGLDNIVVNDNVIESPGVRPSIIWGGAWSGGVGLGRNVSYSGNTIRTPGTPARFDFITGLTVDSNTMIGTATIPVGWLDLNACAIVSVSNNNISEGGGGSNNCIDITNSLTSMSSRCITVSNNTVHGFNGGIFEYIQSGASSLSESISVTGNNVYGCTLGIGLAISDGSVSHVNITGNLIQAATRYCIYTTIGTGDTLTQMVIANNTLHTSADSSPAESAIQIDGAGTANQVLVTGNSVFGGDYSIAFPVTTKSDCIAHGNFTKDGAAGHISPYGTSGNFYA